MEIVTSGERSMDDSAPSSQSLQPLADPSPRSREDMLKHNPFTDS
jgi:hypothetical protein